MPGNVQKAIIEAADDALEEDESQSSLKDLSVVLVLLQSVAQCPDGCVTVAHDIRIDILASHVGMKLLVLGSDAKTAVQVGSVGAQSRKDEVRAN